MLNKYLTVERIAVRRQGTNISGTRSFTSGSSAVSEAHHEALRFLYQAYYFVLKFHLEKD